MAVTGRGPTQVTPKNVDQLRQLVDAGLAQDLSECRHARIMCQFATVLRFPNNARVLIQMAAEALLGVVDHGAELVAAEDLAVQSDPRMRQQHRSAHRELDEQGGHQEQWGQQPEDQRGDHDIEGPLNPPADWARRRLLRGCRCEVLGCRKGEAGIRLGYDPPA
jgi:hypothetical protein